MSLSSAFPGRRSSKQRAEPTQQILVFRLRQEQFALPIQFVQRVILMGEVYGASSEAGIGLTLYQDQELPVIDLERRIFGTPSPEWETSFFEEPSLSLRLDHRRQYYLLIVPNPQGELVGLPLASRPLLRRVPVSTFSSLSNTYRTEGTIHCVTALIKTSPGDPPIFLLDLSQLFNTPTLALPEGH